MTVNIQIPWSHAIKLDLVSYVMWSDYLPGRTKRYPRRPSRAGSFWHLFNVSAVERPPPLTANIAAFPVTWSTVTSLTPYFRLSTSGRRRPWRHASRPTCAAAGKMAAERKPCLTSCTRNTTLTNTASLPEVTSEVHQRLMTPVHAIWGKTWWKRDLLITAPPVGLLQQRRSSAIHQMSLLAMLHQTTCEVTIRYDIYNYKLMHAPWTTTYTRWRRSRHIW